MVAVAVLLVLATAAYACDTSALALCLPPDLSRPDETFCANFVPYRFCVTAAACTASQLYQTNLALFSARSCDAVLAAVAPTMSVRDGDLILTVSTDKTVYLQIGATMKSISSMLDDITDLTAGESSLSARLDLVANSVNAGTASQITALQSSLTEETTRAMSRETSIATITAAVSASLVSVLSSVTAQQTSLSTNAAAITLAQTSTTFEASRAKAAEATLSTSLVSLTATTSISAATLSATINANQAQANAGISSVSASHSTSIAQLSASNAQLSSANSALTMSLSTLQVNYNNLASSLSSLQVSVGTTIPQSITASTSSAQAYADTQVYKLTNCSNSGQAFSPVKQACVSPLLMLASTDNSTCNATTLGALRMVNNNSLSACTNGGWAIQSVQAYGTSPSNPGTSCADIYRKGGTTSGSYYVAAGTLPPVSVYCDQVSYGGGWTMVYATRDDAGGNDNFQQGSYASAILDKIDPGSAVKRIAYDLFLALAASTESYDEVMLAGFVSPTNISTAAYITIPFSRYSFASVGQSDFSSYLAANINRLVKDGAPQCTSLSFYSKEWNTGRTVGCSWDDYSWVAGAVEPGACAWNIEVWNEIDSQGGHVLAPAQWSANGASYASTAASSGFTAGSGIYLMFIRKNPSGAAGSTKALASTNCKALLAGGATTSGVYWITANGVLSAFPVRCDMTTYGGGWTMISSSRDDSTGDNNMKQGSRQSASITALDPGSSLKLLAYDVFKGLDSGSARYSEIMLSGFQSYTNTAPSAFITMYFGRAGDARAKADFTTFIDYGIGRDVGDGDRCTTGSFFTTEKTANRPIGLTWENYAFVGGAVPYGTCAWGLNIWNEIDNEGGHILAPANWNNAVSYSNLSGGGYANHQGVYHVWVR
eukprot:m.628183 g.628183  ORF g.628183 m.628183 type:complete len:887 (-) comp58256_c0_seq2:20-2680(-)